MPRRPDLPCSECGTLMWRGRTSSPEGEAKCRPCRRLSPTYRPKVKKSGLQTWDCEWCGRACSRPWARGQAPKWCAECRDMCVWQMDGATCRARRTLARSKELVHVGHAMRRYAPPTPVNVVKGGEFWSSITSGPCSWCGEQFTALSAFARYCSGRCAKRQAQSRRGRFVIAPATRLTIYERDEWTCQLCSDPVDPSLPPSDMWAATLDHIECQSWALIPDHSPSNLRLAHRWCNSVRGDERWYDASVLKGAA